MEVPADVPSDGRYEISIRYASGEPRPARLYLNGGQASGAVCTATTGGWGWNDQRWSGAGTFALHAGANRIGIARDGPLPALSVIRIVEVE